MKFLGYTIGLVIASLAASYLTERRVEALWLPKVVAAYQAGKDDAIEGMPKPSPQTCTTAQAVIWWADTNVIDARKKFCNFR